MPIVAADLQAWMSENNPEADGTTSGGNIRDSTHASGGITPVMTPLAATDQVELLSDGSDVRTFTITGRDATGAIVSEGPTALNGTTPVASSLTYERLLKVVLSAKDASRTVTVRRLTGGATVFSLAPDVVQGRRMFYDAASESVLVNRYELIYRKNAHATLTLNAAQVTLTADPAARIFIGLATAKGNTSSIADRKNTAPGGVTFVDDGVAQSVPTGVLAAGEFIGVWLRQQLPGDDPPVKNTWTVELAGTTV